MATLFLVLVVVLVLAALVFGVISMLSGDDPGLAPVEPDGRARPLPNTRSLTEGDLKTVRFDLAIRGYRMSQVDRVLRRTAYDLGYKDEMIAVLEAEVMALRDGRTEDAELLRKARESAANPTPPAESLAAFPAIAANAAVPAIAAIADGPEDAPAIDNEDAPSANGHAGSTSVSSSDSSSDSSVGSDSDESVADTKSAHA